MGEGILRRQDKAMSAAEIESFLERMPVAHFATVSGNGSPYVIPNLFVYAEGRLYMHTAAEGHFRDNVERHPRVSFDAAEMGEVFPYGAFACDISTSYASIVGFGAIRILSEAADKSRFFDRFIAKYADPGWGHPESFYPRLHQVTVFSIQPERITGKRTSLPPLSERWPAKNRTRSPDAVPPKPRRPM
jgi:nitroimidazol reductase NimA-like FMN-containing flavoprotein (pyridoxamine 5'-phosphate oxidase superfamily)